MKVRYCKDTNTLHITHVSMPMTVNKAYANIKGRKVLSKEGKIYKSRVTSTLAKELALCSGIFDDLIIPNTPLYMSISLFFSTTENKGWPNKAKSRYKRVDVSNRVKLLEDATFDALGVDDSAVFSLTVSKQDRPEDSTSDFCHIILGRYNGGLPTK